MHAARISCSRHGNWLFSARDWLWHPNCDPAHRAQFGVSVRTLQATLDYRAELEAYGTRSRIPDAGERRKAFETAVVAATAGHAPPAEQWGQLGAREFLNVVHDVTTWSPTNFESFKSPFPATLDYQDWAPYLPPIFQFATSYLRASTTGDPVGPLRLCVNPDERRNALWITMALLGADHPSIPGSGHTIDRLSRQREIFKDQNPAGVSWLVSRMQQWPPTYREACWVGWEELLLPPPAPRCAVVS